MIALLVALAGQLKIPDRLQRLFAWAVLTIGAGLALAAAIGALNAWADARHQMKVERQAMKAREAAADQRAADAIRNTKSEENLHHAIDTAPPGGELSPAAHALACERLRARGRIPASCRPAGGDGSQAGS